MIIRLKPPCSRAKTQDSLYVRVIKALHFWLWFIILPSRAREPLRLRLSGLLLLLGPVLEYPGELYVVKHPILDGSLPEHLINIVIRKPFPHRGEKFPEFVLMNEPRVALVKTTKGILDHFLRVCSLKLLTEQGEDHREVEGSRGL